MKISIASIDHIGDHGNICNQGPEWQCRSQSGQSNIVNLWKSAEIELQYKIDSNTNDHIRKVQTEIIMSA